MKKIISILIYLVTIIQANNLDITLGDFSREVSSHNNINIYVDEDLNNTKVIYSVPDTISNRDLMQLYKKSISKLGYNLSKTGKSYYLSKKINFKINDYIYKLKFDSSSDIKSLLSALGAKFTYLPNLNSFLISATSNTYQSIENYIKEVDKLQKQVILKIMVFEFNDNKALERGIQYGSLYKSVDNTVKSALNTIVAPLSASTPFISSSGFYSAIRLLNQDNEIKIKQFPYVLAKNNKRFKFEAVQNIPYLVSTTTTEATNTSNQNSTEYKDVGLKINGKAFMHEDYLTLDLSLVVEDLIAGTVDTPTPQTYKRILESSTNIDYNKVLLLSGLKRIKHTRNDYSIPYLSNIPFLGEIFKYKTNSDEEINITVAIEVVNTNSKEEKVILNSLSFCEARAKKSEFIDGSCQFNKSVQKKNEK